jgi:hypothetical protein
VSGVLKASIPFKVDSKSKRNVEISFLQLQLKTTPDFVRATFFRVRSWVKRKMVFHAIGNLYDQITKLRVIQSSWREIDD